MASATSAAMKRPLPPAAAISSAVSWPPSAAMSDTTTCAPASAKAMAIARPMPPAPPVTSATLPAKSLLHLSPCLWLGRSQLLTSLRARRRRYAATLAHLLSGSLTRDNS